MLEVKVNHMTRLARHLCSSACIRNVYCVLVVKFSVMIRIFVHMLLLGLLCDIRDSFGQRYFQVDGGVCLWCLPLNS